MMDKIPTVQCSLVGSGRVHFMDWDEAGLVSQWMSQKLSGTKVPERFPLLNSESPGILHLSIVFSSLTYRRAFKYF
jgi:hypothetical protein